MRLVKTIQSLNERNVIINVLVNLLREEVKMDEEQEYRVRLVVNELLVNIFQYSCPHKVSMTMDYHDHMLTLVFLNDGKGFAYEEVLKKSIDDPDCIMSEGGRGVALVRGMSDFLEYGSEGKKVKVGLKLL